MQTDVKKSGQANETAASMVQAGGRAINANIPNRIAQFQRDGT